MGKYQKNPVESMNSEPIYSSTKEGFGRVLEEGKNKRSTRTIHVSTAKVIESMHVPENGPGEYRESDRI